MSRRQSADEQARDELMNALRHKAQLNRLVTKLTGITSGPSLETALDYVTVNLQHHRFQEAHGRGVREQYDGLVELLHRREDPLRKHQVGALIIEPTRELAVQVARDARSTSAGCSPVCERLQPQGCNPKDQAQGLHWAPVGAGAHRTAAAGDALAAAERGADGGRHQRER